MADSEEEVKVVASCDNEGVIVITKDPLSLPWPCRKTLLKLPTFNIRDSQGIFKNIFKNYLIIILFQPSLRRTFSNTQHVLRGIGGV